MVWDKGKRVWFSSSRVPGVLCGERRETAPEWELRTQMSRAQGSRQRSSLGQGSCSLSREARKWASKGRGCKRERNTLAIHSPVFQLAASESSSEAQVTSSPCPIPSWGMRRWQMSVAFLSQLPREEQQLFPNSSPLTAAALQVLRMLFSATQQQVCLKALLFKSYKG